MDDIICCSNSYPHRRIQEEMLSCAKGNSQFQSDHLFDGFEFEYSYYYYSKPTAT